MKADITVPVVSGLRPDAFGAQRRHYNIAGLVILCVSLGAASVFAQPYSLGSINIASVAGASTGGVYSVNTAISQQDGGMSGGNYSVNGGFGSVVGVQTFGAPSLTITYNLHLATVTVAWPSPSTGFSIQVNTNLTTTDWAAPSETVNDDGTNKFIIVTPPTGGRSFRFYRLKK